MKEDSAELSRRSLLKLSAATGIGVFVALLASRAYAALLRVGGQPGDVSAQTVGRLRQQG